MSQIINEAKGADPRIIRELKEAIMRRPFNPNHQRPCIVYDFDAGRVCIEVRS